MRFLHALPVLVLTTGAAASDAEVERLTQELATRARNGQWSGAERAFGELAAIAPPSADATWIGAQAAANLGDAATAYRRVVAAERAAPGVTDGAFTGYLAEYGRVAIHRVEASCISLEAIEPPFNPIHQATVAFAADQLASTGGYFGLLPAGSYRVGPYQLNVLAGPGLATLDRVAGDGDCR
jgi:hypothetical protein